MRRSLSLLALGALTALAVGSAAALSVDGGTIQAGSDAELECDPDGVQVTTWVLEADTGEVHSVRVGGIDAACFGSELIVRVRDGVGTIIGGGDVDPIDNALETVALPTLPDPAAIEQIDVFIEGPSAP